MADQACSLRGNRSRQMCTRSYYSSQMTTVEAMGEQWESSEVKRIVLQWSQMAETVMVSKDSGLFLKEEEDIPRVNSKSTILNCSKMAKGLRFGYGEQQRQNSASPLFKQRYRRRQENENPVLVLEITLGCREGTVVLTRNIHETWTNLVFTKAACFLGAYEEIKVYNGMLRRHGCSSRNIQEAERELHC